ncbi:MAG: hypothetical protein ACJ74T_01920 [Pyrinomonadaceae bacterium]
MRLSDDTSRLTFAVGYANLVYLGLLPALATFGVLYAYGYTGPSFILLLIGGAAAVGVYVAVLFCYMPLPKSLGWALLALLDGPVWALLSLSSRRLFPLGFAVEAFIVDGAAVCLSVLVVAYSRAVSRAAVAGWMLVALAAGGSLVWPYFRDHLWGQWVSLCWLGGGIVESFVAYSKQLERDKPVRAPDTAAVYIVILLMVWVGALIAGNVLHELKLKAAP